MALSGKTGYLYSDTCPPPLEAAGLENPALSFESIKEAFSIAAGAVKYATTGDLGLAVEPEEVEGEEGAKGVGVGVGVNGVGVGGGCTSMPDIGSFGVGEDLRGAGGEREDGLGSESCVELKTGGLLEEGKDKVVDVEEGEGGDILLRGEEPGPKLGGRPCME